jgi:Phage integrase family
MSHHRRAIWVLDLDPIARGSGPVGRRQPFRHDSLEPEPAGVLEDDHAILVGVLVEDDARSRACQQPCQLRLALAERQGSKILAVELQQIERMQDRLAAVGIVEGPLFVSIGKGDRVSRKRLSDNAIGKVVKRYAAAAGFDPRTFAGHSLRADFVTSALEHGADVFKVMDVTRHRRVETLKAYDRRAKAFRDHSGKGFL